MEPSRRETACSLLVREPRFAVETEYATTIRDSASAALGMLEWTALRSRRLDNLEIKEERDSSCMERGWDEVRSEE